MRGISRTTVFARIVLDGHSTLTTRTMSEGSECWMAHRSRCEKDKGLQGSKGGGATAAATLTTVGPTEWQAAAVFHAGWQALLAGPILSVHPWRSPNCKTRAGCDSQAVR